MARSLLDEVENSLPKGKGFAPWYEKLPDDIRKECEQIKAAWQAGRLGTKTGLATALSRSLKARGIDIGYAGVVRWLEKA